MLVSFKDFVIFLSHYEKRRQLRNEKAVLRKGKLIPLSAKDGDELHRHVLAFARFTKQELAIIVINFNDHPAETTIDMKNLRLGFRGVDIKKTALVMTDWNADDEPEVYFTVEEVINYQLRRNIKVNFLLFFDFDRLMEV